MDILNGNRYVYIKFGFTGFGEKFCFVFCDFAGNKVEEG
jgi:hypothetical protein